MWFVSQPPRPSAIRPTAPLLVSAEEEQMAGDDSSRSQMTLTKVTAAEDNSSRSQMTLTKVTVAEDNSSRSQMTLTKVTVAEDNSSRSQMTLTKVTVAEDNSSRTQPTLTEVTVTEDNSSRTQPTLAEVTVTEDDSDRTQLTLTEVTVTEDDSDRTQPTLTEVTVTEDNSSRTQPTLTEVTVTEDDSDRTQLTLTEVTPMEFDSSGTQMTLTEVTLTDDNSDRTQTTPAEVTLTGDNSNTSQMTVTEVTPTDNDSNKAEMTVTEVALTGNDRKRSQTTVTEVALTDNDSNRSPTPDTDREATSTDDSNRSPTPDREATLTGDSNAPHAATTHLPHSQDAAHAVTGEAVTVTLDSQPVVRNGTDSTFHLSATSAETGTLPFSPFSEDEVTEYMQAAESGDITRLQFFVDKGLPVDVLCPRADGHFILCSGKGDTALVKACRGGHMEAAQLLINHGADVNAKTGDPMRQTALHVTVEGQSVEKVRFLLTLGADPNATDCNQDIPLVTAVRRCNANMLRLLLEFGSNVNHQNVNGMTPLHFCFDPGYGVHNPLSRSLHGSIQCAALLIEAGADLDIVRYDRQNPLTMSIRKGNQHAVEFLLMQNCDPDCPASSLVTETEMNENYTRAEVMSPFLTSICVKNLGMLKSLLLAGCRHEDYSCVCFHPHLKAQVHELVSKPRSLMEACRAVLRRKLRKCRGVGLKLNERVEKLSLPRALKDFVLMKELKAEPCTIT